MRVYVEALRAWQRRINLVSARTLQRVWVRHVADALQLLELLPARTARIVDLGSGGGVPGLALALALEAGGPEVLLVESNAKKCAFLRHVVHKAGARATILQRRIETLDPVAIGCDGQTVLTARAVAPLPTLLGLTEPLFAAGAQALWHKGRGWRAEVEAAQAAWRLQWRSHRSVTEREAVILQITDARHV
ncbi:MAG TPA: 16S rRNA (guanine(527)-N(7))-methyltransferase RsmG [Thermopetrobacter sp.]|nr:16S rRNA (guanine(527)-N(7))-methyltransferase RsmG [Thermopetrobacter sp.]